MRDEIITMQNATASFAVPVLSVSSVTTDRPASASKVSWAIPSPADNAFRTYAHLRFRAPSRVYASAGVANGAAMEWSAAPMPCAIL